MDTESGVSRLTRRAWLRLLLWGAGGLAVLAGCTSRRSAPQAWRRPSGRPDRHEPLLTKWARLGWLWAELRAYEKGQRGGPLAITKPMQALWGELEAALDALPAGPELRGVFEHRWNYVAHYGAGGNWTCYTMGSIMTGTELGRVTANQVSELERLVSAGQLNEAAARAAARVLGGQAELVVGRRLLFRKGEKPPPDPEAEFRRRSEALVRRCAAGEVVPAGAARLAGERLVELTVHKLGWLAGAPKDGEGRGEPVAGTHGRP